MQLTLPVGRIYDRGDSIEYVWQQPGKDIGAARDGDIDLEPYKEPKYKILGLQVLTLVVFSSVRLVGERDEGYGEEHANDGCDFSIWNVCSHI